MKPSSVINIEDTPTDAISDNPLCIQCGYLKLLLQPIAHICKDRTNANSKMDKQDKQEKGTLPPVMFSSDSDSELNNTTSEEEAGVSSTTQDEEPIAQTSR